MLTLIGLLSAAGAAAANYLKSNPDVSKQLMNGVKYALYNESTRRSLIDGTKDLAEDVVDFALARENAGWVVDARFFETKMSHEYTLSSGKTTEAISDVIYDYFNSMKGCTSKKEYSDNVYHIQCRADIPRKLIKFNLILYVDVSCDDSCVTVTYESPTKEMIETVKGVFVQGFIFGVGTLSSQLLRYNIPIEMDDRIKQYLSS